MSAHASRTRSKRRSMARLGIILFTYDRPDYAETTLRSTLANLSFDGEVHVHIADDGSPPGQIERLGEAAVREADGRPYRLTAVTATNAERRGYGASYNLATQVVHDLVEYVLALEDDWELRHVLEVGSLIRAVEESGGEIACIRLGYVGWPQELRRRFVYSASQQFLLLDPESPERHVFAGHPRLETVAFERAVGPWPEGLNAGATEFEVAGRPAARQGVAWPLDLRITASQSAGGSAYCHIGAVQARTGQRAAPV